MELVFCAVHDEWLQYEEVPLFMERAWLVEVGKMATQTTTKDDISMQEVAEKNHIDPFAECVVMRVVYSSATIKSQQKDEPDLTLEEKVTYLSDLLQSKPGTFLMRFGRVLDAGHLTYFDDTENYEVKQRLKDLRQTLDPKRKQTVIRNRRFVHMEQLIARGTYFDEAEMRMRDPLSYEHYIGQYLTRDEKEATDCHSSEMRPSSWLLQQADVDQRNRRLACQVERENAALEESDDDEIDGDDNEGLMHDDSGSSDDSGRHTQSESVGVPNIQLSDRPDVASHEKKMLRNEFLQAMQCNFLNGGDADFDYSQVDENPDYDVSKVKEWDELDAYFDVEEPSLSTETEQKTTDMETGLS